MDISNRKVIDPGPQTQPSRDRVRVHTDDDKGIVTRDGNWVDYPDGIGEFVLLEDEETFRRRRRYAWAIGGAGIGVGLLTMAVGILLWLTLFDDPLSDEASRSGVPFIIGMGFFITLLAFAVSVNDCNKWRMAFFATGIILAVPQVGYYQMYMVPWNKMSRCRHAVLRFLGLALVVHYGGQKIAIPETMVGYEKVEALVERNVLFN